MGIMPNQTPRLLVEASDERGSLDKDPSTVTNESASDSESACTDDMRSDSESACTDDMRSVSPSTYDDEFSLASSSEDDSILAIRPSPPGRVACFTKPRARASASLRAHVD